MEQGCQLVEPDVRDVQLKWVREVMQVDVEINADGSRARELTVRGSTSAIDVRWRLATALHAESARLEVHDRTHGTQVAPAAATQV